jgi:hypothetical protein
VLHRIHRGKLPHAKAVHQLQQCRLERQKDQPRRIVAHREHAGRHPQPAGFDTAGIVGCGRNHVRADHEVDREVLARLMPLFQIAPPGSEAVDPSLHGVIVAAHFVHDKVPLPAVLPYGLHPHFPPGVFLGGPVQQRAGNQIVPVAEGVDTDFDDFAHDAFEREAAAVNRGAQVLENDPRLTGTGQRKVIAKGRR